MVNLVELEIERLKIVQEMAQQKANLDEINSKISGIIDPVITDLRNRIGKQTGTIDSEIGGVEFKHVAPKKIEWDQSGLGSIRDQIALGGGDPDKIITAKYSISEKVYETLDPQQKLAVDQYRYETTGTPKIVILLKG